MPRNNPNAETSGLESLKKWNTYYINNAFPRIICCDKCKKWRKTPEIEEKDDVPEKWDCSMWITSDGEKGNCKMPSDVNENDYVDEDYTPGSLVWAKMNGYPKWPAMVEDDPNEEVYCKDLETDAKYHVVFLGDTPSRCWMSTKRLESFKMPTSDENGRKPAKGKKLRIALEDADCALQMSKESRLLKYSFGARLENKRSKENGAGSSTDVGTKRGKRRNRGKTSAQKGDRKRTLLQGYRSGKISVNFVVAPPDSTSESDDDNHTENTYGRFIDERFPPFLHSFT